MATNVISANITSAVDNIFNIGRASNLGRPLAGTLDDIFVIAGTGLSSNSVNDHYTHTTRTNYDRITP